MRAHWVMALVSSGVSQWVLQVIVLSSLWFLVIGRL